MQCFYYFLKNLRASEGQILQNSKSSRTGIEKHFSKAVIEFFIMTLHLEATAQH